VSLVVFEEIKVFIKVGENVSLYAKSLNSTSQMCMYDRLPLISTIVTSCQYHSKCIDPRGCNLFMLQVIILRTIELYRLGRESPPSSACGVMELYLFLKLNFYS
jgi:hypothetical protein